MGAGDEIAAGFDFGSRDCSNWVTNSRIRNFLVVEIGLTKGKSAFRTVPKFRMLGP